MQIAGLTGSVCPQRTSGEKVTVAEQLEPWVIEPPQLSVTAKSPTVVMATLVAVARPVLVRVNVAGPDTVPTVWLPKLILDTASKIVGVPTKPVQEMAAVSGLEAALLVNETVAVRLPAAVGLQFTVAEQVLPAATVPQLLEMVKSPGLDPERVTADTTRLALPVLVAVMFWAPLVVVV